MTATALRGNRRLLGGQLAEHAPELDVGPRGVGLVDALVELVEGQPAGGEVPPQRGDDGVPLGVGDPHAPASPCSLAVTGKGFHPTGPASTDVRRS